MITVTGILSIPFASCPRVSLYLQIVTFFYVRGRVLANSSLVRTTSGNRTPRHAAHSMRSSCYGSVSTAHRFARTEAGSGKIPDSEIIATGATMGMPSGEWPMMMPSAT